MIVSHDPDTPIEPEPWPALRLLAEATGKRFHRGVVLDGGDVSLPFGPRLHALPVSALWRLAAEPV